MKPASLIVDSVSRDRTQSVDGYQVMTGAVRLVGSTHDAACIGAMLGQRVLVLPSPGVEQPRTLAERLLRLTVVVLELGLEPVDLRLQSGSRPLPDRICIHIGQLERLLETYELDYRVRPFEDDNPVEIIAEFRGVEIMAVVFDAEARRWLDLFRGKLEPAPETAGGAE